MPNHHSISRVMKNKICSFCLFFKALCFHGDPFHIEKPSTLPYQRHIRLPAMYSLSTFPTPTFSNACKVNSLYQKRAIFPQFLLFLLTSAIIGHLYRKDCNMNRCSKSNLRLVLNFGAIP